MWSTNILARQSRPCPCHDAQQVVPMCSLSSGCNPSVKLPTAISLRRPLRVPDPQAISCTHRKASSSIHTSSVHSISSKLILEAMPVLDHNNGFTSSALRLLYCGTGNTQDQHPETCYKLNKSQHAPARAQQQQQSPRIFLLEPALQRQWDYVANAGLGDIDVRPHSHLKVQWICDQCPDGHLHSWSATVNNRTSGTGCPQCIGRAVCQHNCLATKAPLVAAQWDREANDGTPYDVTAQSNQPVNWHCAVCGHKWKATPNTRVGKHKAGCPQCARDAQTGKRNKQPTFAECQHALLAEWDFKRNKAKGNYPDNTRLKSQKQIFWLCTECPVGQEHSWSSKPSARVSRGKPGCPLCAGKAACQCNSLQALYPDIAAEWDHAKNKDQPSDYTASSKHVAWWFSSQRGSWQQRIDVRTDPRSRRRRERRNSTM